MIVPLDLERAPTVGTESLDPRLPRIGDGRSPLRRYRVPRTRLVRAPAGTPPPPEAAARRQHIIHDQSRTSSSWQVLLDKEEVPNLPAIPRAAVAGRSRWRILEPHCFDASLGIEERSREVTRAPASDFFTGDCICRGHRHNDRVFRQLQPSIRETTRILQQAATESKRILLPLCWSLIVRDLQAAPAGIARCVAAKADVRPDLSPRTLRD